VSNELSSGADPLDPGRGSLHTGDGINFLLGDGHVTVIPNTIEMTIFGQLSTIGGGEVIPSF
jgi:prepilin-type processing-associated H-X9-DG protein